MATAFNCELSRHSLCLFSILLIVPLACEGVWWQNEGQKHGASGPGVHSPHHPSHQEPMHSVHPVHNPAAGHHTGVPRHSFGANPKKPEPIPVTFSYARGNGKPKLHSVLFTGSDPQDHTLKHGDDGEAHHFDILQNRGSFSSAVWSKRAAKSPAAKVFASLSRAPGSNSDAKLPSTNVVAQLHALTAPASSPPAASSTGTSLQVAGAGASFASDPSDANACDKLPELEQRVHAFWEWARQKGATIDMRHNRLENLLEDILRCRRHVGLHMVDAPGPSCKLRSAVGVSSSVVLVGNGASVIRAGPKSGEMIDAFDDVMRFNNVNVKGFEHAVGRKTTLLFVGSVSEICACVREMKRFGLKSSMCCNDQLALKFWRNFEGQSLKFLSASTRLPVFLLSAPSAPLSVRSLARVWRVAAWPLGEQGNKVLASLVAAGHKGLKTRFQPKSVLRNGMYAVMMLLECGIRPTLAGFDIRLNNQTHYVHHYYPLAGEPVQEFSGRERNSVMKQHQKGYHDFMTEAKVLRELLAEGLISELDSPADQEGTSKGHDNDDKASEGPPAGSAAAAAAAAAHGAKAVDAFRAGSSHVLGPHHAALTQKASVHFHTAPIRWISKPGNTLP